MSYQVVVEEEGEEQQGIGHGCKEQGRGNTWKYVIVDRGGK